MFYFADSDSDVFQNALPIVVFIQYICYYICAEYYIF